VIHALPITTPFDLAILVVYGEEHKFAHFSRLRARSCVHTFPSTPYHLTPSTCVFPLMCETEFHTHTKQKIKLQFCINYIFRSGREDKQFWFKEQLAFCEFKLLLIFFINMILTRHCHCCYQICELSHIFRGFIGYPDAVLQSGGATRTWTYVRIFLHHQGDDTPVHIWQEQVVWMALEKFQWTCRVSNTGRLVIALSQLRLQEGPYTCRNAT
jgi:hypothetical protein